MSAAAEAFDRVLAGGAREVVDLGPVSPPAAVLRARAEAQGWDVLAVDGRRVHDKASALAAVADAGDFPDWFGHNLDALADSLADLSWRPDRPHLVLWSHGGRLALLPARELGALRSVLDDAVAAGNVALVFC